MKIPFANYSIESFYKVLTSRPEEFRMMKILCLNAYFKSWAPPDKFLTLDGIFRKHGFSLRQMGEIMELETTYVDPETEETVPVTYYAYLSPEDQILRCFTMASTREIEKTIEPLSVESGLYHLWISPSAFEQIKNVILSERPHTKITFFSATRKPSMGFRGKIRPDVERTIMYYGDDGKETLEELKYYYGVVPRTIEFHIPGIVDMQIAARGIFTYLRGELDFLLNFSERAIEIALEVRRILERSRLDTVSVRTARKELKVPYMVPWIVDFSQPLDSSGCEILMEELSKNQFTLYNHIMVEGSLRFDATVVDETKKSIFEISATKDRMIVSPRYETQFDSFLRFLETVVENFDPNATCKGAYEP
jgi:hypothetical protein